MLRGVFSLCVFLSHSLLRGDSSLPYLPSIAVRSIAVRSIASMLSDSKTDAVSPSVKPSIFYFVTMGRDVSDLQRPLASVTYTNGDIYYGNWSGGSRVISTDLTLREFLIKLSHSLSLSLTHTLSLSLSHTHTHIDVMTGRESALGETTDTVGEQQSRKLMEISSSL
jgi:hypothetical protein